MLDRIKQLAADMANAGERLFNRVVDQDLFKRVVYAAYLIASADGDFDADEKTALVKLIKKDLPDFTTDDIIVLIRICDSKIGFDLTLGTQEILDEISKASSNTDDAKQIMAVCAFIGASDGTYDKDEKLMARSICYALKLSPAHYGV